jgi:hypothetical protein
MKLLSLLLALNILVSTNGIALYEHICSAMESNATETCCGNQTNSCEMPIAFTDCCQSNFIDFLKQDVESYRFSNIELEELAEQLLIIQLWMPSFQFNFAEIECISPINKPPLLVEIALGHDAASLQVFRC